VRPTVPREPACPPPPAKAAVHLHGEEDAVRGDRDACGDHVLPQGYSSAGLIKRQGDAEKRQSKQQSRRNRRRRRSFGTTAARNCDTRCKQKIGGQFVLKSRRARSRSCARQSAIVGDLREGRFHLDAWHSALRFSSSTTNMTSSRHSISAAVWCNFSRTASTTMNADNDSRDGCGFFINALGPY
jgi:hypothetical protein